MYFMISVSITLFLLVYCDFYLYSYMHTSFCLLILCFQLIISMYLSKFLYFFCYLPHHKYILLISLIFLFLFNTNFSFIFYLVLEVFRHQDIFSVQMAYGESEPYRLHTTSIPIRNS